MKAARESLGLSQDGLAQAVGASKRGIQDNEARKRVPGGEVICGFVVLGINANWLLTGEGPMLLKDIVQPAPSIDEKLLGLCIHGVMLADPNCPPDKAGRLAVQYYNRLKAMDMETDQAA